MKREGFCKGKMGYSSPEAATKGLPRAGHGRVNIYKCVECNKWHIGSWFGKVKRSGTNSYMAEL